MFLKNNIKIKQYYRFVEFTLKLLKQELPHQRCKLICLDEYKVESKEEYKAKRFANAVLYILNNNNQIITKEIIRDIYYLLNEEIINEELVNKILGNIYIEYDSNTYYISAKLHLFILSLNIKDKEKLAFLLMNLLLLKKEKRMVIIYDNSYSEYEEIINKDDVYRLMLLLIRNRCSNYKITKEKLPSLSSIKNSIIKIKDTLKQEYGIEKVYLYGSYSSKCLTPQSDIDILIKYNENILSIEKEERFPELIKMFQDVLQYSKVDFIDFTSAVTRMDLNVLESIITII